MSALKQLPSRASRGSRIHKLIGEEAEADDAFWNQDAWNEDGEDSDYATEAEEEDVVDSDFDEEEDPDEDVHDEDDEDGARRKRGRPTREEQAKRRAYQEPQQATKRPRRAAAPTGSGATIADTSSAHDAAASTEKAVTKSTTVVPYEAPKLRQSTAKKSSDSSDLRRKILEEAARLAAKAKRPQVIKTRLTQEQLLVEAVRTEVENTQSLNRLERLEEEKKAENAITPKAPYTGVIVRYHSRIGMPKTITFLNTGSFPSLFDQKQPRKRERLAPREERVEEDDDDDEDEDEEEGGEGDETAEDDETKNSTAEEDTDSK